jgi:hypothetical protein
VGTTAARPSGHHIEMNTLVDGVGGTLPQLHCPANGMHSESLPNSSLYHGVAYDNQTRNHNGRMPKMNFPTYEGEYTRLCVQQAEDYFEMYDVPPLRWVKVARMNFRGAAAHWIESLATPDKIPWPDFCTQLHHRFGREQRDRLVRQMFHICQTTTVQGL